MYRTDLYTKMEKLFNKYGLETLTMEPEQVTGGLMHKMYQVVTEQKKYAVKVLNSSIMQRKGVAENIVNSERIAKALDDIVPVVSAIQFNNTPLLMLDGEYFMVFNWLDGVSIFPPNISAKYCIKIGTQLAKIHTANITIPDIVKEINSPEVFDWSKYLMLGQDINAEWTHQLSQLIDDLKKWNHELIKAYNSLSDCLVLSHRDLDHKNIIWKDDNPYIIDWESAGYVNPYQELLEVLNYWSNNGNGELDRDKFEALYQAYTAIAGSCHVDWESMLACGFGGMLGWLNYSIKRSLGIEIASMEEKKLGTEQVFGTIEALRQYAKQITLLKGWLEE